MTEAPQTTAGATQPGRTSSERGERTREIAAGCLAALACFALVALVPRPALAAPGVANRLAGADAQGPATESVTAIYHNPAMLGALSGLNFQTTLRGGVDHLAVRRFAIAPDGAGAQRRATRWSRT